MTFIDAAFTRKRTVALLFFVLAIMGMTAYQSIPKESEPDIPIPVIYVSVTHEGIAPEDAEVLIIKPLEKELQSIEGLKEMRSVAAEGYASVTLEFEAGFNAEQAILDVREQVDLAKVELPESSDEPKIMEINVALFPVLTVVLSGPIPERTLIGLAKNMKDRIEALPGVLEVDIGGEREEILEATIDPEDVDAYQLSLNDVANFVNQNNRLVAAGALDNGAGRMVFKVPGILENEQDILSLPIKVADGEAVLFKDVASIHKKLSDPQGFARIDGEPAITLEVTKRTGANIIETVAMVRGLIAEAQKVWPEQIVVSYLLDKSTQIKDMLGDLQNNVLTAIVLVMIVIVAALGPRPAILVGLAIPGSFLSAILVINWMGFTLNIVVLFSLILVVGMLVDGAIVTIELADRKLSEGATKVEAYASASKRMAWPIIASTATTMAVFLPLIFWPGVVGEFMKFLPITVIITLIASLAMALVFIPVIGSILTKDHPGQVDQAPVLSEAKNKLGDAYINSLAFLLRHPGKTLAFATLFLISVYVAYINLGKGVEFFPEAEPNFIQVQIQARGDLSIYERDDIVRRVEALLYEQGEIKTIYARTFNAGQSGENAPEDAVGIIQLELVNWTQRRKAEEIIPDIRETISIIPGVKFQVRKEESGPSGGKPIQIAVSGQNQEHLDDAIDQIRTLLTDIGGFVDIEDSRPLPSIEWQVIIDRKKAAEFGADVGVLGNAVKLITNGILMAEYRPDGQEEEVEVRLRYAFDARNLDTLNTMTIITQKGAVPISHFVSFKTAQKVGTIDRSDGVRVKTVKADVESGLLADDQMKKIKEAYSQLNLEQGVSLDFKGQDEDQKETGEFLGNAFLIAIFLMVIILVTQFDSFFQAGLILSAIVFSTAGVLIGLLVMQQPFGIVMGGIGIIALAGIVVNNNIVLIDTFNEHMKAGKDPMSAILNTAQERARPVLLTSITTVLGLLPMVFAVNIDLINQAISFGAPSTLMWQQLSSAIAGGVSFATLLTLFLTPCVLMLKENVVLKRSKKHHDITYGLKS